MANSWRMEFCRSARHSRSDVGGVQGAENEVTGFRGGHGDAHCFGVAHFADDNDVRRLAQRGPQRRRKIGGVRAYFDLLDDTAHMLMFILDGIFDDDDVAGFAPIDAVDERRERSGFAGTRRATDENEASRDMP